MLNLLQNDTESPIAILTHNCILRNTSEWLFLNFRSGEYKLYLGQNRDKRIIVLSILQE